MFAGLIPVVFFALLPLQYFKLLYIQNMLFAYTSMIIVFLSGIQWHIGMVRKSNILLTISVLLMFVCYVNYFYLSSLVYYTVRWLSQIVLLLIALLIDYFILINISSEAAFLKLRVKITFLFIVALLMIVLKIQYI